MFTRDDATASVTQLPGPDFPSISPLTIEPHGVEKLFSSLNPPKASGPDEIPAPVLKCVALEIVLALSAILGSLFKLVN